MQFAMLHASGEGEASSSRLNKILKVMTLGTSHEGKLNSTYTLRKARTDHPEMFGSVNAKNNNERRIKWMTYKHINDWTNTVKKELIDLGMVIDKPGHLNGIQSEVTLGRADGLKVHQPR